MPKFTSIHGKCHCGNIDFDLRWPDAALEIPVRKCGCTFCRKHSGAWTSHQSAVLEIRIDDRSLVSRYNFGTKTADFYVCSDCGVVPFTISEIDGNQYAVVNVNALDDIGDFSLISSSTDFDGEDTGKRLKRRQGSWIPNVRIH